MDENDNKPSLLFASYLGMVTTGHLHDKIDEDGITKHENTKIETETGTEKCTH